MGQLGPAKSYQYVVIESVLGKSQNKCSRPNETGATIRRVIELGIIWFIGKFAQREEKREGGNRPHSNGFKSITGGYITVPWVVGNT